MGKTISFVATDELAEWIEEESERRMTTVSSTAQQLLAEKYRSETGGSSTDSDSTESATEEDGGSAGLPAIFERHPDKWYRPDTEEGHEFAVRLSDDEWSNRYYKTQDRAAERLKDEYE